MMRAQQASPPTPVRGDEAPGVLFDAREVGRLAETYAPCLTLILQLRSVDDYGDPEVLRKRLLDLLRRCEREALRAGNAPGDVQDVQFALVAFIDETILSSNWARKEHWLAKPLQLELYDRYDAGEEFFVRLEGLRAQPGVHADALEVYYLCMALGFKGRYLLHEQEKLRGLIEDTFTQLSRAPGLQVGALSPNGKPTDQAATEMKSKLPAWVIAVGALVVCVVLYLGMSIYMSNTADHTARAIEAAAGPSSAAAAAAAAPQP